jgi:hypothetical protein
MDITKKAEKYVSYFETGTRTDGNESYVYLKDNAPEKLKEAVRKAHGDRWPDDWVYSTFLSLLERITEYDFESVEDLQESAYEIVDNEVDIHTGGLTKWLSSDNRNVYYIDEGIERFGASDSYGMLSNAQHCAIDEIMQAVISLFE